MAVAAAFASASLLYTAFVGDFIQALLLAATLAAALLAAWNPFETRPEPALGLEVAGRPTSRVTLGRRRPLDAERLTAELIERARTREPPGTDAYWSAELARGGRHRRPTDEERQDFREAVGRYEERVRSWLSEVDAWLAECSRVFVASVLQSNDSAVTAKEAEVELILPADFEPVEELPEFPPPPETPDFPYHPTPMEMMRQTSRRLAETGPPPPGWLSSLVSPMRAVSLWEPDYDRLPNGLRVSYARQPIRHRQTERTGNPLKVRARSLGAFEVPWKVHAENLPHPREGTWKVDVHDEVAGEPIITYEQLQEEVRQLRERLEEDT